MLEVLTPDSTAVLTPDSTVVLNPISKVVLIHVWDRQSPTIISLDGEMGAVGGETVQEIVSSSQQHEQSLNPTALQMKLKKSIQILPMNVKVSENLRDVIVNKNSALLINSSILPSTNDRVTIHPFKTPKYSEMFSDIVKIAKGGGGTVCQAKHNVDQCYYAIKIIPWSLEPRQEEVLKEAIYLAKLDHPNIVKYKTAWFDHCTDQDCIGSTESSPASNPSNTSIDKSTNSDRNCDDINENVTASSSTDSSIVFENVASSTSAALKRSILTNTPRKPLRNISCESRLSDSNVGSEVVEYGRGDEANSARLSNDQTKNGCEPCQNVLIIQMELCRETLMDLLDNRIKSASPKISDVFTLVDETKMLHILQSILKAMDYYHNMGFIHRDLKPKNILFDKNDEVKIGDFGLATTELLKEDTENQSFHLRHTTNIGTVPYAAPEQIEEANYNYKVDMYSLGIIIIELFFPFVTGMEKCEVLQQFKDGNVPTPFLKKWPIQALLILKLLSKNPSERPSAKEVLCSDLFNRIMSEVIQPKLPEIPEIIISQHSSDDEVEEMTNEELRRYALELKKENKYLKQRNQASESN